MPSEPDRSGGDVPIGLLVLPPLLALAASLLLLILPLYSESVASSRNDGSGAGAVVVEERTARLLEREPEVAPLLLVPIVLAGAPLLAGRRARLPVLVVASALLWIACLLGLASIGLFYLPSAVGRPPRGGGPPHAPPSAARRARIARPRTHIEQSAPG